MSSRSAYIIMVGRPKGIKSNSGGIAAPRRLNGNVDWGIVYSEQLRPILDSQIAPNTIRGLMYILKSKDILKKSDYNGLITHCRDWRKDGLIEWDNIIDGSSRGVINDFADYQTIEDFVNDEVDFLRNGGHCYKSSAYKNRKKDLCISI